MYKGFFRKVAFGLGPNDKVPSDPLSWAQAQLDKSPQIDLLGAPSLADQLKIFGDSRLAEENLVDGFTGTAIEFEEKRNEIYNKHGLDFYHPLELQIRHKAAITGQQPVFERFLHFWTNHFAIINPDELRPYVIGPYYREIIRENLTGSFNQLVKRATTGYAMIRSLDNGLSIGPNSSYVRKEKVGGYYDGNAALNENHARELMELHTISPAAGYTQNDVIELSKVMSGWKEKKRWRKIREPKPDMPVIFDEYYHEPKEKIILGKVYNDQENKIPAKEQLFHVIDDLCEMEDCRNFISLKLCSYFIDDNPTEEMINFVKKAWVVSNGNLPSIHKAVVELAFREKNYHKKYLMPETWWLQSAKILDLDYILSEEQNWNYDFKSWPRYQYELSEMMEDLGHHPFVFKQPNGYVDKEKEWISPEMTIRRIVYAKKAYSFIKTENKKRAIREDFLKSVIHQNFDNADEIIKNIFKEKGLMSNKVVYLLNRPEMLRV